MPLILGTNSIKDTGYDVANSVRFNDDDSPKLSRVPSSAGNTKTGTISLWVKKTEINQNTYLYMVDDGSNQFALRFNNDKIMAFHFNGSSYDFDLQTSALFRDVSSWYHIHLKIDTANSTAIERFKLYVNNEYIAFNTTISQNFNGVFFNNSTTHLGVDTVNTNHFDGYFAEFVVIDGTALEPTSFGEFDSDSPNIWKPIDVSGLTFGTNGFHLDFENASSLGADVSGNGNNFTVNNLTSIDQTTDTCTNNYATLNPLLDVNATPTFTEGNLVFQGTGSTNFAGATIPVSSGKWYVEVKATTVSGSYPIIGVIDSQSYKRRDSTYFVGSDIDTNNPSGFAVFSNGDIYHNNDNNFSNLTTTYTSGDIIGMALNMDASPNTLGFYKNGALEVTINLDTAPSGAYMFASAIHSSTSSAKGEFNFGNPTFSISSGNSDGNGYGNFEYAVPSGYYSLNTKNLAEFG